MNGSRFGWTAAVALLLSLVLGAVLSPPDPFTQLLYVGPLFVVLLALGYRYGPWIRDSTTSRR